MSLDDDTTLISERLKLAPIHPQTAAYVSYVLLIKVKNGGVASKYFDIAVRASFALFGWHRPARFVDPLRDRRVIHPAEEGSDFAQSQVATLPHRPHRQAARWQSIFFPAQQAFSDWQSMSLGHPRNDLLAGPSRSCHAAAPLPLAAHAGVPAFCLSSATRNLRSPAPPSAALRRSDLPSRPPIPFPRSDDNAPCSPATASSPGRTLPGPVLR